MGLFCLLFLLVFVFCLFVVLVVVCCRCVCVCWGGGGGSKERKWEIVGRGEVGRKGTERERQIQRQTDRQRLRKSTHAKDALKERKQH